MNNPEPDLPVEEPTVYVIDDDQAVRQSVRWLMESVGRRVEVFDSAESFLANYLPNQPGCILTDVRMPGLGGVTLQEMLRDRDSTIPVIVMTAYGDVPTAVRAMKAGALDFIEKPYNDQLLLDLIERAIKKNRETRIERGEQEAARAKYQLLTPRERQVMALVVQGNSNKMVARTLGISNKTVEAHRAKVMEKMAVKSAAELATIATLCL